MNAHINTWIPKLYKLERSHKSIHITPVYLFTSLNLNYNNRNVYLVNITQFKSPYHVQLFSKDV